MIIHQQEPFDIDTKASDITKHFEQIINITATNEEIVAAVHDAELPPLLAALAMITGDRSHIDADLAPPLPPLGASAVRHGGMSEQALSRGRALAAKTLIKAREHGWANVTSDSELLRATVKFVTGDTSDDYLGLINRELGWPEDAGRPMWCKQDLAPDRTFKVVIVGAGLSGVAAAYRLSQANVPFIVLEKNSRTGGVWNDNKYPGCRLDTPNFAYGYSFAQKSDWPQQFSKRDEIIKYIDAVTQYGALDDSFQFDTEVVRMEYDSIEGGWWITTRSQGCEKMLFANVVVSAVGHLNRPSVPDIPGAETFLGEAFHSAEWPAHVQLGNKRVAVIGTGASGFQIIPAIADQVENLVVFQRNPSWMLPTPNYHDDISPGMRWLFSHVPQFGRWFRFWQFWIGAEGRFPSIVVDPEWKCATSVSALNEKLRQECLRSLTEQCGDRLDLLEKLTPSYAPGVKRMVRDNGSYVETLKKSNVHLINEKISRFTPTGIVTEDGVLHELDIVIYATGFYASDYLAPIEVIGEAGIKLHDFWEGDSRAYLGISVPGNPNLFILGGPNSGLVVNGSAVLTTESALQFVMNAIEYILREKKKAVDVLPEVYAAFNEEVDSENLKRTWGLATVNTWYQGKNGRASVPWPYSIAEYFNRTSHFEPDKYHLDSF